MLSPVLSESRRLRFAVFTVYYFMQGLPIGLIFVALPAWFTMQDVPKESIATFLGVAGLPWALKLIAGPLIDRFNQSPMGLRRPWIMAMLLLNMIGAAGLFLVSDLQEDFGLLLFICTCMNAFAATEDVAVDGLAIAIIPEPERGRANAFMGAGQIIGISITGAVSISLLNSFGINAVAVFLLLVLSIIFGITLWIREQRQHRFLPWSKDDASGMGSEAPPNTFARAKELCHHLFRPMSLLLCFVAFLYSSTEGMLEVWRPQVAINHLGYSDTTYTHWYSTVSLIAAVSALVYGPVIDKVGPKRSYRWVLLFGSLYYLFLYFAIDAIENDLMAFAALFVLRLVTALIFVASIALSMSICRLSVATTQFACYMAIYNIGRSTGSWLYPKVVDISGIIGVGVALSIILFVSWSLIGFFRKDTLAGGNGD